VDSGAFIGMSLDVDIGICSVYLWPDTYLKLEVAINFKSSLWELWLPVFITLVNFTG
jgi:hypothetical protein